MHCLARFIAGARVPAARRRLRAVPWIAAGLLAAAAAHAQEAPAAPRRGMVAQRAAVAPHLDGRLDDPVWRTADFHDDLLQRDPVELAAPTERTQVALAYDDDALYVAARMFSRDPGAIVRTVSRRDEASNAEWFFISLDTYHDRKTAWTLAVSAGGSRADRYHPDDDWMTTDDTWSPVWEAHVAVDSAGWTAELRIPFSQLRYNDTRVWGVNFGRTIPSRNEEDFWIVVPRRAVGWASRFGTLSGLDGIAPAHAIELLPYVAGEGTLVSPARLAPGDPFAERRTVNGRAGLDLKAGLGRGLVLDATVNPDFGQVEGDPAEVNLSGFETVFEERRPFFTEGAHLLSPDATPTYFYSRRVGSAPHGVASADFTDRPATTPILGAVKVTGRLASRVSVAAIAALTDRAFARTYDSASARFGRTRIEPRTGYASARIQQEVGANGSVVGVVLTGLGRGLSAGDPLADALNRSAVSGGIDWRLRSPGGAWRLSGFAGGSTVRGSAAAIAALQRNPAHRFQRPDAGYLSLDTTRTGLSGWTAQLRLDRQSGRIQGQFAVSAWSPGIDLNDAGQSRRGDVRRVQAEVYYLRPTPGRWWQRFQTGLFARGDWNFGGDRTVFFLNPWLDLTLPSYVHANVQVEVAPLTSVDDEMTRGGPLVGIGRYWYASAALESDVNAPAGWRLRGTLQRNPRSGWRGWTGGAGAFLRTSSALTLDADLRFDHSIRGRQYIATLDGVGGPAATGGRRYVISRMRRPEIGLQLRATYLFTADMSLQLYVEPFLASRTFFAIGELPRPGAIALREYGTDGTTLTRAVDGAYDVTDGADRFRLANPDFTTRSFRSNVVFRWEWARGSTLFLVWQMDRGDRRDVAETVTPGGLAGAAGTPGRNVFVIKISRWTTLSGLP